jgi:rhamnulokinase
MATPITLLAADLGAESGRLVRGEFGPEGLSISEVARFPTGMSRIDGHLRWDLHRILEDLEAALRRGGAEGPVGSLGVDTWGVDFGLLDQEERLVELPVAYRDGRTEGVMEAFLEKVPRASVYERTGIQFLPFNTLYQLAAMASDKKDPALTRARHLLLMPDLVHHHLTGVRSTEFTIATTTQCFNPRKGTWDTGLLEAAGVSPSLFQEVVESGTVIGKLAPALADATGLGPIPVIAPAAHDTASAVAAVPARRENWAFISSGTWSLMGVETNGPVITPRALERNFTNEGGLAGTNRFLKNITGLWLVQRLREELAPDSAYDELVEGASSAPPLVSLVEPDDRRFLNPGSMAEAMAAFCRENSQPVPATPEAFVRSALESLALKYRGVLADIVEVTGLEVEVIHVVGGGSRNRLLNQMTADATGLPVRAGPVEATAVGNLLAQAMSLGLLASHEEGRDLVGRSFPGETFEPRDTGPWDEAWEKSSRWRES